MLQNLPSVAVVIGALRDNISLFIAYAQKEAFKRLYRCNKREQQPKLLKMTLIDTSLHRRIERNTCPQTRPLLAKYCAYTKNRSDQIVYTNGEITNQTIKTIKAWVKTGYAPFIPNLSFWFLQVNKY